MKKLILGLAVVSMAVACKKVPDGTNKGVIKMDHSAESYRDDHQGGGVAGHSAEGTSVIESKTTVDIDINGVKVSGVADGLEDKLVKFLSSDGYKNATDDAALKDTWYNFDTVNFKTGSANQLEAGSEGQIKNLATILKAYPDVKIKIGGYTDKTGNEAANVKLSLDRANFIKSELTKLGVGAQVLSTDGYGSKFAKVPAEASDAERAADRKMAVRLAK